MYHSDETELLTNFMQVGADVVEVAPAYDGTGETTALAAAQVAFEVLTSMIKRGLVEENVHDEL